MASRHEGVSSVAPTAGRAPNRSTKPRVSSTLAGPPQASPSTLSSQRAPTSSRATSSRHRTTASPSTSVRHASSSTTKNKGSGSSSNSSSASSKNLTPAPCPGCEKARINFRCSSCLTHFKSVYHQKQAGARKDLLESKRRVEALLGPLEEPEEGATSESILGRWPAIPGSYAAPAATTSSPSPKRPSGLRRLLSIPDPFGDYDEEDKLEQQGGNQGEQNKRGPHKGASHAARELRARKAALQLEILEMRQMNAMASQSATRASARNRERRAQLDRRKTMLEQARALMSGGELDDSGASHVQLQRAQEVMNELEKRSDDVAKELAKVRALRAKEVISIFQVRPPSGSLARLNADRLVSTSTSRNQRSRERYMSSGIFDLAAVNPASSRQTESPPALAPINPNDWTIVELVLPVISDLRRFERDSINGAVSHTVHLLHLLADYLGVVLPFLMSDEGGKLNIRANQLYSSLNSTGEQESLVLTHEAHGSLGPAVAASSSQGAAGGLGASMMGSLTASTMWTLDSFVSVKRLNSGESSTTSTAPAPDSASLSAKEFRSALTKLAYNAAYLTHVQGARVELVHAAGSTLRLLSKATLSKSLGKMAHTTYHGPSHARDLSFPGLELSQLLQINEKDSRGDTKDSSSASSSPSSKKYAPTGVSRPPRLTKEKGRPTLLEESYVDARQAAESILELDRGAGKESSSTRKEGAPYPKAHSKKVAGSSSRPQAPINVVTTPERRIARTHSGAHEQLDKVGSLNFLKARGAKARAQAAPASVTTTKTTTTGATTIASAHSTASSTRTAEIKPAPPEKPKEGTVTFNGVEVRAKSTSKLAGRKSSSSASPPPSASPLLPTRPYSDARRARDGLAQGSGTDVDEDDEWDVVER
ncbi:hypothetical protein FA10DRAFT_301772 [Acaromyces ingoldii]|uniref:Autophagy-related protein 14 n=1 Tax=Acaromyces ingoldii TaxID=215250 RepID=A0A316YN01_9BASI|nr:hypothetical protein FA10DRAFT_301772 [Acaromyces ingoldii]PWN90532.1 hypothetical protein FA10DRAFT_301772 [Acaromyces ingoldii]